MERFKRRLHTIVATQVSVTDWKVRIQPLSLSSHLTSGRLCAAQGTVTMVQTGAYLTRASHNACRTEGEGEESLL